MSDRRGRARRGARQNALAIAGVMADGPLCVPCLAARVESTIPVIEAYLAIVEQSTTVRRRRQGHCRVCGALAPVASLAVPIVTGDRRTAGLRVRPGRRLA